MTTGDNHDNVAVLAARLLTYSTRRRPPGPRTGVIVDLSGLGYIPSAGIALLLEIADEALHPGLRYPAGAFVDRVALSPA